jgi:hypothetical protein
MDRKYVSQGDLLVEIIGGKKIPERQTSHDRLPILFRKLVFQGQAPGTTLHLKIYRGITIIHAISD